MNINDYAQQIYAQNKAIGWWDDPHRCTLQTLQLVSTEIAEATEGERKNLMDDHLPRRKMGEVELADALIRTLDLGGRYEWKFRGVSYNRLLDHVTSIGGKHLVLNMSLCMLGDAVASSGHQESLEVLYSVLINSLLVVGESQGYDVEQAMVEKLEYNKQRLDHKRSSRAAEHGKKF